MKAPRLDEDEGFFYCCLWSENSGLPMRNWTTDSCAADPHIRVQTGHWHESRPNDVILCSITTRQRLVAGMGLAADDWKKVKEFIAANIKCPQAYLTGAIDTGDLARQLRKV